MASDQSHAHLWLAIAGALLALAAASPAAAHAIAGERLFPSTLNFDDPGIGAELPLVFSHGRSDGVTNNELELSITKPITPGFSLTAETGYLSAHAPGAGSVRGWDNLTLGAVWQVFHNAADESIGSFSIHRTSQHTGSRAVREDTSSWAPEFDVGKGLGNASAGWLRPFAMTGSFAVDLPDAASAPRMLDWGTSIQYSIPYLQNFVKYAGIKGPWARMIPLVEFPMQTCLDHGCSGQTTGYVAPGVIWLGRYVQWGVELQVPVNHRTGNSIGIMFGLDFYLDDLAPHGFGAPLFR
jgi:hypothetical protein